jgi:hypothetical protein
VDEWAKESGSGEFLEVSARFGEPAADAFDSADPEAAADEAVEGDAARDDVAARLSARTYHDFLIYRWSP